VDDCPPLPPVPVEVDDCPPAPPVPVLLVDVSVSSSPQPATARPAPRTSGVTAARTPRWARACRSSTSQKLRIVRRISFSDTGCLLNGNHTTPSQSVRSGGAASQFPTRMALRSRAPLPGRRRASPSRAPPVGQLASFLGVFEKPRPIASGDGAPPENRLAAEQGFRAANWLHRAVTPQPYLGPAAMTSLGATSAYSLKFSLKLSTRALAFAS